MSAAPRSRLTDAQRALLWQLAANPGARVISGLRAAWVEDGGGLVLGPIRVKATIAALVRRGFVEFDVAGVWYGQKAKSLRLTEAGRVAANETVAGGKS